MVFKYVEQYGIKHTNSRANKKALTQLGVEGMNCGNKNDAKPGIELGTRGLSVHCSKGMR